MENVVSDTVFHSLSHESVFIRSVGSRLHLRRCQLSTQFDLPSTLVALYIHWKPPNKQMNGARWWQWPSPYLRRSCLWHLSSRAWNWSMHGSHCEHPMHAHSKYTSYNVFAAKMKILLNPKSIGVMLFASDCQDVFCLNARTTFNPRIAFSYSIT